METVIESLITWWPFWLGLAILVALVLLMQIWALPRNLPYLARGQLVTKSELKFYKSLSKAVQDDFQIFAMVRIADLLRVEKNNKHRMVQIGEYETAQYTSHKNILKVIVYGIVVLILITYLMAFSWFPRNAGIVLIILTITITLGLTAKNILENYGRDNLVWSQFNQGTDANQLNNELKNGGLSVWDYNKRSMEKAYDSAKSEASSALTAVADGSAKDELESKFKNELNTIQATTTGQVQASDSQTKEGFAPF